MANGASITPTTNVSKFANIPQLDGEPVRCSRCGKSIATNLIGTNYRLDFTCPRCKAPNTIIMKSRSSKSPTKTKVVSI